MEYYVKVIGKDWGKAIPFNFRINAKSLAEAKKAAQIYVNKSEGKEAHLWRILKVIPVKNALLTKESLGSLILDINIGMEKQHIDMDRQDIADFVYTNFWRIKDLTYTEAYERLFYALKNHGERAVYNLRGKRLKGEATILELPEKSQDNVMKYYAQIQRLIEKFNANNERLGNAIDSQYYNDGTPNRYEYMQKYIGDLRNERKSIKKEMEKKAYSIQRIFARNGHDVSFERIASATGFIGLYMKSDLRWM